MVKYIKVSRGEEIGLNRFPKCHIAYSVREMRKTKWGKDALIVRSGNYYYNVSSEPKIYEEAK